MTDAVKNGMALITGATAGLGAEFAQQLGAQRYNLVLVARDTGRLEAKAVKLRQDFGIAVETITADLRTDSGVAAVAARLTQPENHVTVLVNNAGYGLAGQFEQNTRQEELDQLNILVSTPMQLMHAALEPMLARGRGRIINVASMAGFIPRGTYGASKAWIISFSKWANINYGPRGVHVTAVCPGFVHTEFHQRMGASTAKIPAWMWLEADRVVGEGLAAAFMGKSVSVPSKRYAVLAALSRFMPERLGAYAGKRGR
ncbi:SDR family NAD(P)-dependent oxidoreductase [Paenarthrobacter sp. PH39-S1]|uniref:SDR family NAD(P)-dependent oxidoreductase n=1 Tax=Paenarthrobacter sp. PH39-S1 TaxID=3046204 RepID=UPI0024B9C668|nr:SDR family NAD(P)-dependent oxidoreductase [Paenarthrobacter sp. PH39-S1]MDJ0354950.1 SDR family NAD(P)-dependent oxidoreductase [Paenarthrobacter sp. PH39-S1]